MTKFMEKTEIKDLSIKDAVQKLNMGDMNIHTLRDVLNCQNATDQDMVYFIKMAMHYDLNPLLKEIYIIKYNRDGKPQPAQIILAKSAWLKRARQNPRYDGHKAICIKEDNEYVGVATVRIKGITEPIEYRAYFKEYSTGKSLWATKPRLMITKCALVGALREAFPETFSGLYDEAEFQKQDNDLIKKEKEIEVIAKNETPTPERPKINYVSRSEALDEINGLTLEELLKKEDNPVTAILKRVSPVDYRSLHNHAQMRAVSLRGNNNQQVETVAELVNEELV
tara:strand:+ start:174 stop:1019 length:846 start_codon:yes stop_codon:yes gene_type:complete